MSSYQSKIFVQKNKLFTLVNYFFKITFFLIFVMSIFMNTAYAVTGSPRIMNHQGRLLDSSGNLLGGSGGTNYCFRFSFYDDSSVGVPDSRLWPTATPQKMTVFVKNGIFSVPIGDTSVGGDVLDFDFSSLYF